MDFSGACLFSASCKYFSILCKDHPNLNLVAGVPQYVNWLQSHELQCLFIYCNLLIQLIFYIFNSPGKLSPNNYLIELSLTDTGNI